MCDFASLSLSDFSDNMFIWTESERATSVAVWLASNEPIHQKPNPPVALSTNSSFIVTPLARSSSLMVSGRVITFSIKLQETSGSSKFVFVTRKLSNSWPAFLV